MLRRANELLKEQRGHDAVPRRISVAAPGISRAQVSPKLLNFTITLKDGQEPELESVDAKGAEELISTVSAHLS